VTKATDGETVWIGTYWATICRNNLRTLIQNLKKFKNKIALVTGASKGIIIYTTIDHDNRSLPYPNIMPDKKDPSH